MRHLKDGRKLSRTAAHRKALLANLAVAVIEHKHIRTTTQKAKEARRLLERMITHAKKGTVAARRHVFSKLRRRTAVTELFNEIAPKYAGRQGGYTRVLKLGRRQGDGAELSVLELVGYETVQIEKQQKAQERRAERQKRQKEQASEREKQKAAKEAEAEKE
jgi:large subunit ribosomal protein L17